MTDEIQPQRAEYSVREAFLEDVRIARELGHLSDKSRFWTVLEELIEQTSNDRVSELETRVSRLEEIIQTGK